MLKTFSRLMVVLLCSIGFAEASQFNYRCLVSSVSQVTDKFVALTFDDGPVPETTPQILKVLQAQGIKATFFMLGSHIKAFPNLVKEVRDQGHEIGNHSFSHPILTKQSHEQIWEELHKTQVLLGNLGIQGSWFRPPYGSSNQKVREVVTELGLHMMLWTVDTQDWHTKSQSRLMASLAKDLKSGSVILMHDTKHLTADSLNAIIVNLKQQGYRFMTLSDWQQHIHEGTQCLTRVAKG